MRVCAAMSDANGVSAQSNAARCPECGVATKYLTRHLRKVHSIDARAVKASNGLIFLCCCPVCHRPIGERRLRAHLRYCEGPTAPHSTKQPSHKPATRSGPPKGEHPTTGSPIREAQFERTQDAGREHYVIRDRGRFGSTPSYDGYGDEDRA
jgi:hypothetical protein